MTNEHRDPLDSAVRCRSIVARSLAPHVSVLASNDTEELCRDIGFNSFRDLLRPFGDHVPGRITIRDTQGVTSSYEDFSIHFVSPKRSPSNSSNRNSLTPGTATPVKTAPKPSIPTTPNSQTGTHLSAPKFSPSHVRGRSIDSLFTRNVNPNFSLYDRDTLEEDMSKALKNSASHTETYLDLFQKLLTEIPLTPFETFSHPVAGVIAISSRNETPIETLSTLYKTSYESIPEYINRDYLRYYVLVHDESTDINKSIALYEKMKRNFGLHCHMIRIRRPIVEDTPTELIPPPEWQTFDEAEEFQNRQPIYLHEADINSVKVMTRELVVQSIIPFMERCINTWNEQIASGRRGIAGRFFSASRKYFSSKNSIFSTGQQQAFPFSFSNSSSASPSVSETATTDTFTSSKPFYGYNTAEALLRKLADFSFMLRDYGFAHSTYELIKGDFHSAKAWSYLAAAQEMSAVSYLMSPESRNLSIKSRNDLIESLLDSATYSYISRCSLPSYAFRCILVASELLCTTNSPSAASDGATRWLLKGINDDLTGPIGKALLLERISNAYGVYQSIVYDQAKNDSKVSVASSELDTEKSDREKKQSAEILVARNHKSSRQRKRAFWMLLAARQWTAISEYSSNDPNTPSQYLKDAEETIEKCGESYEGINWPFNPDRLLGQLVTVIENKSKGIPNVNPDVQVE